MASCVVWSASCGEGGRVGCGGAGSLHCVRTADSARTTAPSISVMGTPVQCITLITLASAFSAAQKKKKKNRKTFAAADGQQDARSASPSSISNQERAGKCLPRRRDTERGGASVGSHYRQTEGLVAETSRAQSQASQHFSISSLWLIFIINITARIYKTNGTCLIIGPINKQALHQRNRVGRKSDYQSNANGVAVHCYICLILKAKIHTVLI